MLPSSSLAPDGRPLSWRPNAFNIFFHLGALRQDKLRACDDMKHPMANPAGSASTPIQLLSWGHISQLSQMMGPNGGDWALFKEDRESAYKQLPIRPDDMKRAIAAIRRPYKEAMVGFVNRTLIFGSIAAVIHYNVMSRILAGSSLRCLGLPPCGQFLAILMQSSQNNWDRRLFGFPPASAPTLESR